VTDTAKDARPKATRSLSEALAGSHNSLGFIRLVLAATVIFYHGFQLGGYGHDPLDVLTNKQTDLAVGGFFAISGYLIAKSGIGLDVVQFVWRRALRILPAFWTVLLFTALIVGPLIWVLDGHPFLDYFSFGGGGPVSYLWSNWHLLQLSYGIYDLFAQTTPYGLELGGVSIFNGSLWTLAYEWNCYMIIAALVAFGILRNARLVVPVLTGLVFILQDLGGAVFRGSHGDPSDPRLPGRLVPGTVFTLHPV
jgi:peptidoglycan/LPS O-acetylase OafA/YrhL